MPQNPFHSRSSQILYNVTDGPMPRYSMNHKSSHTQCCALLVFGSSWEGIAPTEATPGPRGSCLCDQGVTELYPTSFPSEGGWVERPPSPYPSLIPPIFSIRLPPFSPLAPSYSSSSVCPALSSSHSLSSSSISTAFPVSAPSSHASTVPSPLPVTPLPFYLFSPLFVHLPLYVNLVAWLFFSF